MQTIIRQRATEQLSDAKLREWQRYRGHTLKILEDLEHSGGKTTRAISDGTGIRCVAVTNACCRMLKQDLVERVERWGWRITRDGLFLLSLSLNTTTTPPQDVSGTFQAELGGETAMPQQTALQETNVGPPCYQATTCHIKRLCKDKRYTLRNQDRVCSTCIHDDLRRDFPRRIPQEIRVVGS